MVEVAIISTVMMVTLLSVIEVSRAFFVWNTLDEVARRGARLAAVCPIGDPNIPNLAILNSSGGTESPIVNGLNSGHVSIEYLDLNGGAITDTTANFSQIEFVRATIVNYQHQVLLPFVSRIISPPPFQTTIPRESLGITAEGMQTC